jgi:hypothetical protein
MIGHGGCFTAVPLLAASGTLALAGASEIASARPE